MSESKNNDAIARCLLQSDSLRAVVVLNTHLVVDICERHQAKGLLAVGLARTSTSALLLASLTKNDESVTLRIATDGRIGGLTADAKSNGNVRAYPSKIDATLPAAPAGVRVSLSSFLGKNGLVSVARDLGLKENFSGQTDLSGREVDTDVEHYLCMSEQIDSVLVCDAELDELGNIVRSGGLLLQAMPDSTHKETLERLREELHTSSFLDALRAADEAGALVRHVLGEMADDLKVLETRPVQFACPCSRERAESTLRLLGESDLESLLADPGTADVMCEFCQTRYVFEATDLVALCAGFRTQRPS
ncbi:MAG: Hsp33 family molecular chaperone HslO [Deltaproteobacteria bacterium]|nr:Hsp33 family molecular chaperone HslO [Deltaproteobacteria bacterium]